jgi:hypothetical protein
VTVLRPITTRRSFAAEIARGAKDLAKVASLYVTVGSPHKTAELLQCTKNVSDDPSQIYELVERLAQISQM